MDKTHLFFVLFLQVLLGLIILTAIGVGRIPGQGQEPGDVSFEGNVSDAGVEAVQISEQGMNLSRVSGQEGTRLVTSTTSITSTTSTIYVTTTRPVVLAFDLGIFKCPSGIPDGAVHMNASYASSFRDWYVLPNGAFVGPYVVWYDPYRGHKQSLTCFGSYGREDGPSMEWSPDGVLVSEKNYVDGVPSGVYKAYYPSGALEEEADYLNGRLFGTVKFLYENGVVKSSVTYVGGKKYGAYSEYYPGGSLKEEKYYDGDEWSGVLVSYYGSGRKYWEWQGKNDGGKFSGLFADWSRGVGCIYKDAKALDCRYLKEESYKTGEIILNDLKVYPGSERMNAIPQFFDEPE